MYSRSIHLVLLFLIVIHVLVNSQYLPMRLVNPTGINTIASHLSPSPLQGTLLHHLRLLHLLSLLINLFYIAFVLLSILNDLVEESVLARASLELLLLTPLSYFVVTPLEFYFLCLLLLMLPMVDRLHFIKNLVFNLFLIISCLERVNWTMGFFDV